eukprot:1143638-Pelagomonas_calceolata.AAC.7
MPRSEQQLFRLGQMDVYCLLHGAHARVLHEHCSSMPGVPHSAQEQQLSRLGHHVYCLLHGPSVKDPVSTSNHVRGCEKPMHCSNPNTLCSQLSSLQTYFSARSVSAWPQVLELSGQAKWSSDISAFVKIITKHDNDVQRTPYIEIALRASAYGLFMFHKSQVSGCSEPSIWPSVWRHPYTSGGKGDQFWLPGKSES